MPFGCKCCYIGWIYGVMGYPRPASKASKPASHKLIPVSPSHKLTHFCYTGAVIANGMRLFS